MSGDIQIDLLLHAYRADALAAALEKEGVTIEERMQDALTELYVAQVPRETRQEISARIKEELAAREAELEASQQCAVFHVREGGREEYFQLNQDYELLEAAQTLQRYLRQEPGIDAGSFADLFPNREIISPEEFDRLVLLRMENTGKVTGAFDLDFDKREFSAVHIMNGWSTWAMEDVSAAAYHAFRESCLSEDARYEILLNELDGKGITYQARSAQLMEEGMMMQM